MIEVPVLWDDFNGTPVKWLRFIQHHEENSGCVNGCVLHHRTDHHMSRWPLHWRSDTGIFERVCECGVGHPDPDQFPYWESEGQEWRKVHGCCGCCGNPVPPFPVADDERDGLLVYLDSGGGLLAHLDAMKTAFEDLLSEATSLVKRLSGKSDESQKESKFEVEEPVFAPQCLRCGGPTAGGHPVCGRDREDPW